MTYPGRWHWLFKDFSMLRSKPCSAWNRPNRPRFTSGHRFCHSIGIPIILQHTVVSFEMSTLVEKNRSCYMRTSWGLVEIAAIPCNSLFLFISYISYGQQIAALKKRLFGSVWKWKHFLYSRLQILQNANLLQF